MLEGVLGEAARAGVGVATELVLVHAEGVAPLTGDWVSGLRSRPVGHCRRDKGVDKEERSIWVDGPIGHQGEGFEEGPIV